MQRPQSKIIDAQHVESEREVTGWEAEQLLRKYGHEPQHCSSHIEQESSNTAQLSFEEMVYQEETKRKNEMIRNQQRINGLKPITFDENMGYDSEIKYSTDKETGFGFKIEISTDMKIPKY